MRVLLTALPLTDQACCHVEIAGEDRLAGALAKTKRADFFGRQRLHRREAQVIEFAHSALVHDAGGLKAFGGLVDRSHKRTTVLLAHRTSPPSMFRTRSPA